MRLAIDTARSQLWQPQTNIFFQMVLGSFAQLLSPGQSLSYFPRAHCERKDSDSRTKTPRSNALVHFDCEARRTEASNTMASTNAQFYPRSSTFK
jgi:hypothetical protein